MQNLVSGMVLSTLVAFPVAAQSTPAPSAPANPNLISDITLQEVFGFYGKRDASSVVELNTTVKARVMDFTTLNISLPTYVSDDSGYGSVEVGMTNNIVRDWAVLGGKMDLDFNLGLYLPTGSTVYSTSEVAPHVGGVVSQNWSAWTVSQSFDYTFVTGDTYSALLGYQTTQDLITMVTELNYDLSNTLDVGANFTQLYEVDGSQVLLLGPELKWNPSSNVSVTLGVGFPVSQTVAVENSAVVSGGVGFSF